jgi:PKD repeat protein
MNRSSKIPKSLGVGGLFKRKPLVLPLFLTLLSYPLINAEAATKISIPKAKFDAKLQKVVVTGKTSGSAPYSQLSIYDPADHRLLFSGQTNAKSAFNFSFPQDKIPCLVELELGDASVTVKVSGTNPKNCKTAAKQTPVPGTLGHLSCSIKGTNRVTNEGTDQSFEILTKSKGLSFDWDFGDGNQASNKQNINHAFSHAGLYKVKATGLDSTGLIQCTDSITVSVTPPAGTNIHAPVAETSVTPNLASAMPGKNGENDTDAIVVFPFEDMGMEGGSQINIPFNPLVPYNALNAQVLQKIPNKPKLLDSTNYQVTYSAAANPKDPAGAGSINSTSQNYFQGNKKGSNFDYEATNALNSTTKETKYLDDQSYDKALIAKSEFWDKIHHPNATKLATPTVEKGLSQGDTQNTYTPAKPLLKPDEGLRGYVDKGAGVRAMPGKAAPYEANDAQPMDYSESQQSFVAQNIPATSIDDQGKTNPFPLMRVEVKEGNTLKSAIDAVYTTASETGCRTCHIKGEKGSDDTVWRTPVTINELLNPDGSPGPATGKGAFPPANPTIPVLTGDTIADFKKYGYGPAVHNLFDGIFPLNPTQKMVADGITLEKDANGIRTDRVAESRWLKPDGTTSPTNPNKEASWKLQIRLKFKDASDYGDNSWQNQEKAARWNTMLLHDYMTPINYNNARDDVFAEIADDKYTTRAAVTICASHHTSTLKQDTGAAAVSQVRTLSDWTRTTHAFHGKMQVYKQDVTAAQSPDKLAHKKGELIRDERGHPIMWGGRGWDTIDNDKNRLPMTKDADGNFTKPADEFLPNARNNWAPDLFPPHPLGQEMLPVGENIDMDNNCLTCHTGKTEKSYRDIHHAAGMKCDSCHGGMLAVGLTYPNEIYDGNRTMAGALGNDDPATLTAPDFRRAWLDEPDCGSCHVGDANLKKDGDAGLNHYFSVGSLKQGWADNDKSNASIHPVNARFAVMPSIESRPEKLAATDADVAAGLAAKKGDTIYKQRDISQSLYRKSGDVHGSGGNGILNCSTCHGGSHGIWPNKDPNANDNVTAKQLQGYDGNIAECSTCHIKDDFKTGLVATDGGVSGLGVAQGKRDGTVVSPASLTNKGHAFLAGPHGMHPVGDEYWYKHAEGAAKNTSKGKHKPDLNGGWHNDMAGMPGPDGEDQCSACHGADHKGTRLSRTLVDRVLINAKGKAIKVAKDTVIGCNLCHSLEKSFSSRPQGGWKEAKLHHAPLPEAVSSNSDSGGSSHGH